jgi:hypothetical protein
MVADTKDVSLEENTEKTKYIYTSHHQTAGQNHNIKMANKYSENMEKLKYLGMTLSNTNCIH